MVCFRRSLVKGSTAYQYTSLQVQQCYKGLEKSVFGIFSWTIWKPADSAMRCISPTCSKPLRCQNLPAAQFHLWSEIYSESKTGGEFLAKQSIITEGKDHRDTEGHLRFDVPVEDFSVVHVFQRQADLDEPIQDLHRRRDGDREGGRAAALNLHTPQCSSLFILSHDTNRARCLPALQRTAHLSGN